MRVCVLSLLAVVLCTSVSQAALSDVSVVGNGSLQTSGGGATVAGDKNIGFTWADVLADDVVADAASTVGTGTLGTSRTWNVNGWITGSGYTTDITANMTVDELLQTANAGDWASDDVLIKLQLFNDQGTEIDVAEYHVARTEQDGSVFDDDTAVALTVTTPLSLSGSSNSGTLKLTVVVGAEAFTAEVSDPDPDPDPDPVIPAPGAIFLGSIGAGLVGWLRKRHTL